MVRNSIGGGRTIDEFERVLSDIVLAGMEADWKTVNDWVCIQMKVWSEPLGLPCSEFPLSSLRKLLPAFKFEPSPPCHTIGSEGSSSAELNIY